MKPPSSHRFWLLLALAVSAGLAVVWLRRPEPPVQVATALKRTDSPAAPATRSPPAATASSATATTFQAWTTRPWDEAALTDGLSFIKNNTLPLEVRLAALDRLSARANFMTDGQLKHFVGELLIQAKDPAQPSPLVAAVIDALTRLMTIAEDRGLFSKSTILQETNFLIEIAGNPAGDRSVRSRAIQAVGRLGMRDGLAMLETVMADPVTLDAAELARPGCLSLLALAGESATPTIARILSGTSDSAVFGTAAYCLGKIKTPEAMAQLVQNRDKFPDSPAIGAALVEFDEVILKILGDDTSAHIAEAVAGTKYLWREGQEARYSAALRTLVRTAAQPIRVAALNRLVEQAQSHGFETEKRELSEILVLIGPQKDLAPQAARIQQRLSATIVLPNGASEAIPPPR